VAGADPAIDQAAASPLGLGFCAFTVQTSVTRFKGPTSEGREGTEGKREKKEGWREGRGSPPPPFQIPGSVTVMWIISLLFRKSF